MRDSINRLIQLIGEYADKEGCSLTQKEQIIALVKNTIDTGVPENEVKLKRILERIGGGY